MAVFLREECCSQADFAAVLKRAHAEGAPPAESESRWFFAKLQYVRRTSERRQKIVFVCKAPTLNLYSTWMNVHLCLH